ncbi:unnamed protein product [[Candida] boidinii]|uniref:Unnamed protein product n=1 Tax=Candida boidinii TaxID=5477 RepID=A0ACB5TK43_CANBO|nr:unnamed protein product [[Candida] boidinii]
MASEGISVAFVCTEKGLDNKITKIDSFGTHSYHVGENPDHRTLQTCNYHKVPIKHSAQQISKDDFKKFDYVICMDNYNLSSLEKIQPSNSKAKLNLFGHWKEDKSYETIVDDPYYGGINGFQKCFEQCMHFSEVFLKNELN